MAWSLNLWLCLHLSLLLTDAKSVRQHPAQGPSPDLETSSAATPDSLWSSKPLGSGDDILNQNRLLSEMLDLDQHRRSARGTDGEDEQQSTFGRSFENDFVTAPQPTELSNITTAGAGDPQDADNLDLRGNTSDRDAPGLFNPFYPLVESSYVAYAVLLLAGLVLAVGVVGNMAVMCIVWNNYYMRSAWNYLLATMAFWDFLVLVLCLPVIVLNQISHRRIMGDVTCLMVPYMEVGVAYFSNFSRMSLKVEVGVVYFPHFKDVLVWRWVWLIFPHF